MRRLISLTGLILLLCVAMHAQMVDSGSTGADGPFNPPGQMPAGSQVQGNCASAPGCTVTVPLREPPNHIFNFTTVTIGPLVTVKFRRNVVNTPVFILAQGNVTINGTIDVSGQNADRGSTAALGGPGGFNGGVAGLPGTPTGRGGTGIGPGGGSAFDQGSGGSFGTQGSPTSFNAPVYGIPELLPLIGGSGGGSGSVSGSLPGGNGGGGGGALLIASSATIDLGSGSGSAITANGGNSYNIAPEANGGGGGSGGGIRLVATALRGSRSLLARGGAGFQRFGGQAPGGAGRIRLESVRLEYTGGTDPAASFSEPGQAGPVFPPVTPTVRVVSIAGVAVSGQPTSDISTPDVTLPASFTNPVSVVIEATNVPSGTPARVIATPQLGSGPRVITDPVPLTGPQGQPKRATVNVNFPTRGVLIVSAVIDSVAPGP